MQNFERQEIAAFSWPKTEKIDQLKVFGSGYPLFLWVVLFSTFIFAVPLMITAGFYGLHYSGGGKCTTEGKLVKNLRALEGLMAKNWDFGGEEKFGLGGSEKFLNLGKNGEVRSTNEVYTDRSARKFLRFVAGKVENEVMESGFLGKIQNIALGQKNSGSKGKNLRKRVQKDPAAGAKGGAFSTLPAGDLPALPPILKTKKNSNITSLEIFMTFYCNLRINSNNMNDCKLFAQHKCLTNWTTYCKMIAYRKMVSTYLSRACVANWGINPTMLGLGNSPFLKVTQEPWYDYINMFTVFSIFIITQIFAVFYRTRAVDYDNEVISCSDYSVIVKGVPKRVEGAHYHIREEVCELLTKHGYNVTQIILMYHPEKYHDLVSANEQVKNEMSQYLYRTTVDKSNRDDSELKGILKRLSETQVKILIYEEQTLGHVTEEFQGVCIVSLRSQGEAQKLRTNHQKRGF